MMRRLALAMSIVALTAAVAVSGVFADDALQVLVVRAAKPTVTYGQPVRLHITALQAMGETITVESRPFGVADWKALRTLPASRAAETTSYALSVKPSVLTEYRVRQGEVESDIASVAVRAKLSKPEARATIRAERTLTIRGLIWPGHAKGSQAVLVKAYRPTTVWVHGRRKVVWRQDPSAELEATMVTRNRWRVSWRPTADDKGLWMFKAYHWDAEHVPALSQGKAVRVR